MGGSHRRARRRDRFVLVSLCALGIAVLAVSVALLAGSGTAPRRTSGRVNPAPAVPAGATPAVVTPSAADTSSPAGPTASPAASPAAASTGTATAPTSTSTPTPAAVGAATPATPSPTVVVYTVKAGDNLWSIANWFHMHGYGDLYEANKAQLGRNPSLIHPGLQLTVSAAPTPASPALPSPVSTG